MNRLGQEKSPYLLQHAGNPVHWWPWSQAALAQAEETRQPILLSIGYAACHWCHVMAHESFEDAETAALMNQHFVNIKVDREERPDIDHIYMAALHALGEHGGWPLTMFLTPDAAPFWGGTYFPPEPRWGRPSFRQLLVAVADAVRLGDSAVGSNRAALARALVASAAPQPGNAITPDLLPRVGKAYLRRIDLLHGGLSGAPKFPNAPVFRFLFQLGGEFRAPVHALLRHMSQGGIYDHLGGGYARYSTDAEWLVPHFEKMLYDNAQLLELLAFAHAAAPDPLYVERAVETADWLCRDMSVAGAFAASEDADSEGEEGRFYVWTAAEIAAVLGPAAAEFASAYDVTPQGNWEGRAILRRVTTRGSAEQEQSLAASRAALCAVRARRPRPGRDDKVLADWNGLAIAALARAACVFDRPEWLLRARDAYGRILALLGMRDGRVQHAWREDRVTAAGLLEDQAAMARAALTLFEITGEPGYLSDSVRIAGAARRWFGDTDGSLFGTASDATDVPVLRPRSAADSATPNAQALLAETWARLHHLTGEPEFRGLAQAIIDAYGGAGDALAGMPTLLGAAHMLEAATTVVVSGSLSGAGAQSLLRTALAAADPALCVLRIPQSAPLPKLHPAHGKTPPPGTEASAFVCRAGTCSLALSDAAALHERLRQSEVLP